MSLLLVRNTEPGPTVFAKNGVSHIWAPADDPSGRDILRVSDAMLDDPDFLDTVDRGVLVIEDANDEAVRERLETHKASAAALRARTQQRQSALLDRRQQRDIVGEECIGPGPAGRKLPCAAPVLRPAKERTEIPPLCTNHQHLINDFVLVQTGSKGDDRDPLKQVWSRRVMQ